MLMLSLSTSGPIASAAVIKDGQVLSLEVGGHGRTHSETIMPLCEKALQTAGYTPKNMDAFGVDAGPGSFTGVRIGICAANAMAAAFGKPVAAASSLEGLLYGIDNACALLDCRNGNGYAMVKYEGFSPEPMAVVIDDLLSTLPDGILMAGDGAVMHRERILNAFRELACSGIYAQLAGGEYKAVGFAGMAVGAEGGGGAIAFDDVFHGSSPFDLCIM